MVTLPSPSKLFCACVVVSILLSGVGGVVTAAPPQATEISSCTTISSPGEYVLTGDIENGDTSPCIDIRADDVTLDGDGHTVDGTDSPNTIGVSARGASNPVVKNVVVTEWKRGLQFQSVTDGRITGVTASDNEQFGIRLEDTTNSVVDGVTTNANGFEVAADEKRLIAGIGLFGSTDNTVRNAVAKRNTRHGIIVADDSDGNVVESSTASVNDGDGITVRRSSDDNRVVNNRIVDNGQVSWDGDGVELTESSSNNLVRNNLIEGSRSDGVSVNYDFLSGYEATESPGTNDNRVGNNRIVDNGRGVHLLRANGTKVVDNRIADSRDRGVRVKHGGNNNVVLNTIRASGSDGVLLSETTENLLWSNRVLDSNTDGVVLESAHDNRLGNNTFVGSGIHGVNLTDSDDNRFETSEVRANGVSGIDLTDSNGNAFLTSEIRANDGDGFDALDSDRNRVARNTFVDNEHVAVFVHGDSVGNTVRNNDDGPDRKHVLQVHGSGTWSEYGFVVSDGVNGANRLEGPDSFGGRTASGGVSVGTDAYRFTGSLASLWAQEGATVLLDGERVDPSDYSPSHLTVEGAGDWSSYRVTVEGTVVGDSRLEDHDSVGDASASGGVGVGPDNYRFAGGVPTLVVNGDATASVNGEPLDPQVHTLRVEGTGDWSRYRVTVDGEFLSGGDSFDGDTATGGVGTGSDTYTFVGDVSDVETSGDVTVYLDGEEVSTE